MLSNLGITEEHHYTLMGDLEGKQKLVVLWRKPGNPDLFIMDEPTNDLDLKRLRG
jgi:ATPase subunit of ABC transporter with duplicated ATPase domains